MAPLICATATRTLQQRTAAANAAPPGEREMTGDRYFNLIRDIVARNMRYPDVFRRDGLAGRVLFQMTLARDGDIADVQLAQSSGNTAIDLYAEEVIRRSAPVPPLPPNYPGPTLRLNVFIVVEPR